MSTTTSTIPIVMTSTGVQPQSPSSLLAQLIAYVSATNPGYTANLPATLIEDIASTDVGALALCDSAFVDLVNSITPGSANEYLLVQLGQQFGIPQGVGYNTNVDVVFTGSVGYVIPAGFVVTDGYYQYETQDVAVISSTGVSTSVYCLATLSGSWSVPAATVTQLVTAIPATVTLTVTNPIAGTAGSGTETVQAYQARVVQAGLAQCQGMTTALRNAIQQVSGVQSNLVSIRQSSSSWEVIVGGGDPYEVALAIFQGMGDISNLVGSTMSVANITQANPGVVSTNLNHGYTTGQVIQITGIVGMTALNGVNLTVTVLTEKTFSIGVNTTSYGAYVSGGVITPNLRNTTISLNDYPDTYSITYVEPPQQIVTMTITWQTFSTNYVNPTSVSSYSQADIVNYINGITVGQPINLLEVQQIFQDAIADILPSSLLVSLTFVVAINGVTTAPESGTSIIPGDTESYFFTSAADITIVQA